MGPTKEVNAADSKTADGTHTHKQAKKKKRKKKIEKSQRVTDFKTTASKVLRKWPCPRPAGIAKAKVKRSIGLAPVKRRNPQAPAKY